MFTQQWYDLYADLYSQLFKLVAEPGLSPGEGVQIVKKHMKHSQCKLICT